MTPDNTELQAVHANGTIIWYPKTDRDRRIDQTTGIAPKTPTLTFYRADYIDGEPRYFATETFDTFLELADRGGLIGKPIRIYTITRQHYGEATSTS